MWRKKNPFSFDFKDYFNDPDCYRITKDEWIKKNECENTDYCDECGSWRGQLIICPECKL